MLSSGLTLTVESDIAGKELAPPLLWSVQLYSLDHPMLDKVDGDIAGRGVGSSDQLAHLISLERRRSQSNSLGLSSS